MSWELDQETNNLLVNGERVYVAMRGGILHCMVRCSSKEVFWEQALLVGLVEHSDPGSPAIIDPITNEETSPEVPPSGPLKAVRGVTITELGPYVLTPGTYDEEFNEITPPVLDERHHVNFWLSHDLVKLGKWEEWALTWTQNGIAAQANKNEEAIEFQGIELIDPNTVASPSNVLL